MIGGLVGGVLGDRFGRRTALLGSVIAFAVLTIADRLRQLASAMLGVLRFLAGIGLGGAMPNAATLASEYVPRRQRPFAVTLTIVCIPLGGFLASSMASLVAPAYGWRALFIVGGVVPIVLAALLWKVLPESPRYLASRRERWPELARMLRRMGHDVPRRCRRIVEARGSRRRAAGQGRRSAICSRRGSARHHRPVRLVLLLPDGQLRRHPAVPSMLRDAGEFTPAAAPGGLQWVNIGGVVGAVLGALVIQRFGSRVTMLGMSAAAIVCSMSWPACSSIPPTRWR